MSRRIHRLTRFSMMAIIAAAAAGLALSACGTEEEAGPTSAPEQSIVSENPSAPAVGGPRPPATTEAATGDTEHAGECGMTSGPDGALRVVVLGGDVACDEAQELAEEYSPMIATGRPQSVSGWECGPSAESGMMAVCVRDGDRIGFQP